MTPKDAQEFIESLGQIIGGSWRQVALAQKLGVPKALGLTTDQWVNERLGGYVKLARDDRREAVKELKAEGHSNVEIGKVLGAAESTIRNDVASADSQNCEASEKTHSEIGAASSTSSQNCEVNSEGNDETGRAPSGEIKTLDAVAALAIDTAHRRGNVTGVAMHPYAERGLDLYETPREAVRALLRAEKFSGPIWEPACGPGAIVRELRASGHSVIATDVKDYGCPDSRGGVDFLAERRAPDGVQTILTNPPFMHADEFVRHALTLVPRVVMLLRFLFLEGQGRTDLIDGGHLARVHLFIDRVPLMHRGGWNGPEADSSQMALAWMLWDRNFRGPIEVRRIWCREKEAKAAE
jgi:hypothetical protein